MTSRYYLLSKDLSSKHYVYIGIQDDYNAEYNVLHGKNNTVSAPTIAEVIMWVYEKHNIWISVKSLFDHEIYGKKDKWEYDVTNLNNAAYYNNILEFNTPTEAYLAAIEYCLTKLIK